MANAIIDAINATVAADETNQMTAIDAIKSAIEDLVTTKTEEVVKDETGKETKVSKIVDADINTLKTLIEGLKDMKKSLEEKTKEIQQVKAKAAKVKTAAEKLAWAKANWSTNDLVVYYYATGKRYMLARFVEFKEKTAHLEIAKSEATSTGKTRRNVGYDKIECISAVDFLAEDPNRITQYAKVYKELTGHDITDDFSLEEDSAEEATVEEATA